MNGIHEESNSIPSMQTSRVKLCFQCFKHTSEKTPAHSSPLKGEGKEK